MPGMHPFASPNAHRAESPDGFCPGVLRFLDACVRIAAPFGGTQQPVRVEWWWCSSTKRLDQSFVNLGHMLTFGKPRIRILPRKDESCTKAEGRLIESSPELAGLEFGDSFQGQYLRANLIEGARRPRISLFERASERRYDVCCAFEVSTWQELKLPMRRGTNSFVFWSVLVLADSFLDR